MKIARLAIALLVVLIVFGNGQKTVLGQYTDTQIKESTWNCTENCTTTTYQYPHTGTVYTQPATGTGSDATNYSNQTYSGFYKSDVNGLYYPIGGSTTNNGTKGSGPANSGGACTGVYGSCTAWSTCSTTCGEGTQTDTCYDTGCGTEQVNTQSCIVNDPTVWGAWSTCTMNCGTGTQSRTNQCGTVATQDCNTQTCGPWVKLKNESFSSTASFTDLIPPSPIAYDSDDTTDPYLIVGNDGVVAAPSITIDTSNVSQTTHTGSPEYKALYTSSSYAMTPSIFFSYVTARKQNTVITNPALSEITGSGIYT